MVSTSVTDQDLNSILSAGSNAVQDIYKRFGTYFPGQKMREVGLTDIFMVIAQEKAENENKNVKFGRSYNENTTGSDFEVMVNGGYRVFFQAKIGKKLGKETYSDFLYESKRTVNGQTILEYQNLLLAEYAKQQGAHAYYVIYDEKAVWWINATALGNWLGKSGVTGSNNEICLAAFKELAKTSYLDAYLDAMKRAVAGK
ncbi:uncharacterized protein LW93_1468 [Fusarium fujikuroi]|nr:uncharacterized protein LW93_1468 [Fusarium fujikuroi]SCV25217.1 uncharacterized protein FFB14_00110 [Fusarium fujikuroi]